LPQATRCGSPEQGPKYLKRKDNFKSGPMITVLQGIANKPLPVTLPLAVVHPPSDPHPVFFGRSGGAFRARRCHKKDNPDRIFLKGKEEVALNASGLFL
jgi:hypothetical protein